MSKDQSEAGHYILTLSCPDRIGVVAAVATFLTEQGGDIVDSAQFGDRQSGRFFLRTAFLSTKGVRLAELRQAFAPLASEYGMNFGFHDARTKTRTLIMVSKFGHCLNDLLYRIRIGALPIEVPRRGSSAHKGAAW